jgi:hypothetical protein
MPVIAAAARTTGLYSCPVVGIKMKRRRRRGGMSQTVAGRRRRV